jgi:hypothetical protein
MKNKIMNTNEIDLYGTLLEKQNEIITLIKKTKKLVREKAKLSEEVNWYRVYGNYIGKVYSNIDAEACGYADGDEEYEENIRKAKVGFYKIEDVLLKK